MSIRSAKPQGLGFRDKALGFRASSSVETFQLHLLVDHGLGSMVCPCKTKNAKPEGLKAELAIDRSYHDGVLLSPHILWV